MCVLISMIYVVCVLIVQVLEMIVIVGHTMVSVAESGTRKGIMRVVAMDHDGVQVIFRIRVILLCVIIYCCLLCCGR